MQSKCEGQVHDKCKAIPKRKCTTNECKREGQMHDKCKAKAGTTCTTNAQQMQKANA